MASASPTTSSDIDPLAPRFATWRSTGHKVLIPYMTAGFPQPASTVRILHSLADAGADLIELGVPFSDPVADGPTIQRSSQVALEHGVTVADTLRLLETFRRSSGVPVVIFSYLNPILGYGVDRFLADAAAAGADGVLITDLPAGCDAALEQRFHASPLSFVRLVAPTTPRERLADIVARAQGFLYYVGRMGVTGAATELRADTLREVAALREQVSLPVAVGFGVATAEHARQIAAAADGVIVGSALINALDRDGIAGMTRLLRSLREAMA